MDNCVFCRIVAGKLPSDKVYEDDLVFAFLDIAPLSKGHALIVPKEHHNSLTTLPPRYSARMIEVASKLGVALMRAVGGDGFNLLLSNGACAGQIVPHVHLHVIPRRNDDGVLLPAKTMKYDSPDEKAGIMDKAKARLSV